MTMYYVVTLSEKVADKIQLKISNICTVADDRESALKTILSITRVKGISKFV